MPPFRTLNPAILAGYLAGFASAIAAMFPNDAAAICPPKMRLTVGMETPLRNAKI